MNPVGCNSDQLEKILKYCGFDNSIMGDNKKIIYFINKKKKSKKNSK